MGHSVNLTNLGPEVGLALRYRTDRDGDFAMSCVKPQRRIDLALQSCSHAVGRAGLAIGDIGWRLGCRRGRDDRFPGNCRRGNQSGAVVLGAAGGPLLILVALPGAVF
jgi:hypothetical protein